MPNHVPALALNESVNAFEDVLQAARTLDRKTGADQDENQEKKSEDQHFHGDSVRYRRLRILRLDMQPTQKRSRWTSEQIVEKLGKAELFRH